MGILEQIQADIAEIKAALAGGAAPAAATPTTKPAETAAQKKAREKVAAEAAKPTFTAEELRDKYIAVMEKFGDVEAKSLIAVAGYDKLAKLVADAPNWQKSWDLANEKLEEEPAGDEENGGL